MEEQTETCQSESLWTVVMASGRVFGSLRIEELRELQWTLNAQEVIVISEDLPRSQCLRVHSLEKRRVVLARLWGPRNPGTAVAAEHSVAGTKEQTRDCCVTQQPRSAVCLPAQSSRGLDN